MKEELTSLRRGNSVLNSEQHERDKTLAHLRTRVAVLEQELRDKEQVCMIKCFHPYCMALYSVEYGVCMMVSFEHHYQNALGFFFHIEIHTVF